MSQNTVPFIGGPFDPTPVNTGGGFIDGLLNGWYQVELADRAVRYKEAEARQAAQRDTPAPNVNVPNPWADASIGGPRQLNDRGLSVLGIELDRDLAPFVLVAAALLMVKVFN